MNAQDTLVILQALQAMGATHFKSGDFEIRIGEPEKHVGVQTPVTRKVQEELAAQNMIAAAHGQMPLGANPDATRAAQELIDKLKLKDAELIDQIFPAGAGT